MHHFLEFRAACEFFETAPEFRAVLLLDFGRRGSKVDLVLFAGANFLALGLAVLWIVIHFFGRPYGTRSFASPDPAPKCCLKLGRPIGARSLFEIYTQIQNSEPKNTETSVLPVTRIATRNVHHRAQMIFLHQVLTQRKLVCVRLALVHHRQICRRLLIPHIENLLARAQIFLRRAMALDAPLHLQRGVIEHQRHAINRAVTGIAADALIYMNAVVEINEVGQIVHPIPDQRLARPEALAHRLEQGRARPDL